MCVKLNLATRLRNAIRSRELHLYYQPQYEVENGNACGIEALARWDSKSGVAISPTIFIDVAERHGSIASLGEWVLQEACRTVGAWLCPEEVPALLCVNVSARQISTTFPDIVARVTKVTGFPPERLELEITESVLIEDSGAALECLAQCKQLGVRIALDDFGTGYSNLSYLSRLPLDRLKLDKSLIRNITSRRRDVAIVRTVILLGRELGYPVIAAASTGGGDECSGSGRGQLQGFRESADDPILEYPRYCARRVRKRLYLGEDAGWIAAFAVEV